VETIAKLQNCGNQRIPVYISEEVFNELVLPFLVRNKRGPQPNVSYYKLFHYIIYILYTGCQWKMIPIDTGSDGKPEVHYTNIYRQWKKWVEKGSIENIFRNTISKLQSLGKLSLETIQVDGTNTVAKNGGDKTGYSGHKHQKGNKIIAATDKNGYVLAGANIETVNQSDMKLLIQSLNELKSNLKPFKDEIKGRSTINLDSGFDSKENRKLITQAGFKPNIKENKRNRKTPKRGRKRLFDGGEYKFRKVVERTFSWADKFRRVVIQYEWYQEIFLAFNLLAFILINLKDIC